MLLFVVSRMVTYYHMRSQEYVCVISQYFMYGLTLCLCIQIHRLSFRGESCLGAVTQEVLFVRHSFHHDAKANDVGVAMSGAGSTLTRLVPHGSSSGGDSTPHGAYACGGVDG